MQEIPDSLGQCAALKRLTIDTCFHVATLPCSILQLPWLEELYLHNSEEYGSLPDLPLNIGHLPKLRKLHITSASMQCRMPALPGILAGSTTLMELRFGFLKLVNRAAAIWK